MTPRAIVIGGSLGGLTAALTLRDLGCAVTVYERAAAPLIGQGAGIVLHPATLRYLRERAAFDVNAVSVPARAVRYVGPAGETLHELPCRYRFSSYNALYRGLFTRFGTEQYRLGAAVERVEQTTAAATVRLSNGRADSAALVVCADGIRSNARRRLLPDATLAYAGYVAWRGTAALDELSPGAVAALGEAIVYYLEPGGHLLTYPIPVSDRETGALRTEINWLWYRNVPEGATLRALLTDREDVTREVSVPAGAVQERHVAALRADAQALPPVLAELLLTTAQPFVQVICDLEPERMAFGRVCLIGDAAFVARPHAAAGTAKACADAWALSEALAAAGGDVPAALAAWEPRQLALGRSVLARTREAGRRLQLDGAWRVGEPLPFGLYEQGDSEL